MKISEQEIKRIASPTIYKRGLEYYKDGRVHIKSREEQKIVALVDGEDIYSVSINFDGEKIKNGFCTCPYYRTMDSVCKHIVATLKKRQAELLEGENYKDENDKLAQNLCSEFLDNCFEKPRLAMSFTLNIAAAADRRCRYSIEMKCGFEELKRIESIDRFLYSYINAEDFKISKHKAINSSKYSLSAADEEIINILCEAYLNKTNDDIYNPRISRFDISAPSAKRLLPYLINADVSFTLTHFRSMIFGQLRITPIFW